MARPTRRDFVKQVAILGAGSLGGLSIACRARPPAPALPSSDAAAPPALRTFTAAQYATLSAVCERLLPRDADPGASDLGVPLYIDRAVAAPALASTREVIVRLLPALDRQSRKRFAGRDFAAALPDEQDLLLTAWQRGAAGERRFFHTVLELTLEGAFGDPKHGGNIGGRGFALIGFTPGPPMTTPHH